MTKFTVAIIIKNCEDKIRAVVEQFADIDCDFLFYDDRSSDKTAHVASQYGQLIKGRQTATDFSEMRNICLSSSLTDWIFFMDSDEFISDELKTFLSEFSPTESTGAYRVRRVDIFWGKQVRFGELFTQTYSGIIRLVKKGSVDFTGRVHETAVVRHGDILQASGWLDHHPHDSVAQFVRSINFYSTIRAQELKSNFNSPKVVMQMILYPPAKFWYTYIIKLGFLDGARGFVYSFLMAFHSFLVRAKLLSELA
jgi:glycosyltransferase involved in cell wall biosynthesis